MAFSNEICKLVIENVDLLEEAPTVIEEIENKVFNEINNRFKAYFDDREGWKNDGAYNYLGDGDGETTFAPIGWPEDEETDYTAFYQFRCNSGEDYLYWLTALTGKTSLVKYGIYFSVDINSMGMNKKQWKNFLMNQYQSKQILQESGVTYEEVSLCIPITIDPKLMAEEYPDFDTCLKPVDYALEILMKVNPHIDEIVKTAISSSMPNE